jgi:Kef-type K+ transport system membrane component KefB
MQAFLEVSLILALATGMAILMQSLRLPLLLGHILTGILVGPAVWHILQAKETVEIFSQLGITALLFVVGLGLHPQVIREVGKIALLTGIGQVVFTTGFGFILALLFGFSWISALCIAIALTFSSTIIVTKILSDRGDSGKLYGKISIGFLLVQDVIATLILILVGSIGGAQDVRSLVVVVGIKLLIVAATMLVTAQFILPRLTRLFAASQEFLFLFSIGWGVGLAAIFYAIGLSVEIGALAAGVTLASSPYRYEINAKMRLVRGLIEAGN